MKRLMMKHMIRESILSGTKCFIFGFIDQSIMVLCGDAMDLRVKVMFGLVGATGTMVAAGIGNAISDAFGEGFAASIERWLEKMGLRDQKLTKEEFKMLRFRIVRKVSPVVGIFLGCIAGLIVLPIKRFFM